MTLESVRAGATAAKLNVTLSLVEDVGADGPLAMLGRWGRKVTFVSEAYLQMVNMQEEAAAIRMIEAFSSNAAMRSSTISFLKRLLVGSDTAPSLTRNVVYTPEGRTEMVYIWLIPVLVVEEADVQRCLQQGIALADAAARPPRLGMLTYIDKASSLAREVENRLREHMSLKYTPTPVTMVDGEGYVVMQNAASITNVGSQGSEGRTAGGFRLNYLQELFVSDPTANDDMRAVTSTGRTWSRRLRVSDSPLLRAWMQLGPAEERWHEVAVSRFRDPAYRSFTAAYIVAETDVTATVLAKRQVTTLQRQQQALLREILPQQVIDVLLHDSGSASATGSPSGLPTPAPSAASGLVRHVSGGGLLSSYPLRRQALGLGAPPERCSSLPQVSSGRPSGHLQQLMSMGSSGLGSSFSSGVMSSSWLLPNTPSTRAISCHQQQQPTAPAAGAAAAWAAAAAAAESGSAAPLQRRAVQGAGGSAQAGPRAASRRNSSAAAGDGGGGGGGCDCESRASEEVDDEEAKEQSLGSEEQEEQGDAGQGAGVEGESCGHSGSDPGSESDPGPDPDPDQDQDRGVDEVVFPGPADLTAGAVCGDSEPQHRVTYSGNTAAGIALSRRDVMALATWHEDVTVVFADIVGFTSMCQQLHPARVMAFLDDLYNAFDHLLDETGCYKVETIGDCYMVCSGLFGRPPPDAPDPAPGNGESQPAQEVNGGRVEVVPAPLQLGGFDPEHATRALHFAKRLVQVASDFRTPVGTPVQLRVGLHSGSVVSGVVGRRMPRFCLFGDTVNTASRMESTSAPGRIHVSEATRSLLPGERWEPRGTGIDIKGRGRMQTYFWKSHY
ncbi:hypothetical protein HYH02_013020 [Chlamydomonas schloesseri]|uniref:Guanylate cyclase domain-containing protein n=1 Tax=Chlamydomonas schloesseri TaxID=2026947 RepID=A0A835VWV2_9CHLO|nr:hypothetical protein HYH02_013020 [Chlamydomonas schloesseri]|eukprot:KAG2432297.1 hypothetical protein HYH02_013020 [Chlamydomonas schloesseri]